MRPVASPNLTLAAQYLRHVADFVRSAEVDVEGWLAMHGLEEAELEEAALTMSLAEFRQLLLDAIALTREPALGLFVGERLVPRTHGFVGYASMNSRTLRELLDVLSQFLSLRISILALSYEVEGPYVRARIDERIPLGDIQRPVVEAVVMSIRNTLQATSMGAIQITRVELPFAAPDYAELASEMFGCEVRYGAPGVAMLLPADVLDQRLKMADPRVFAEAAQILQRQLDQLEASASWSGRVRRVLLESQAGFPSLQATARLLHVTPRTLHRRLKDEQTAYREILDDIRFRLATDQLRAGVSSIEEIAYTLGYSDPANFRRAFKRWARVPPSAYRDGARR